MISRKGMRTGATQLVGAVASCVLLGACASSQVPEKDLADSEAAVRAANELGAKGTPEAALHLQMAKDRLARAESLNKKGEGDSAKALLEEAKADAELAVVLTREQQAETDAKQAEEKVGSAPQPTTQSQPEE